MIKNYWLTGLLATTITLSFSCSNQINNVTETSKNSLTKASFEDDEISCPSEQKKFNVKNESENILIKDEDRLKSNPAGKEDNLNEYQFFNPKKKIKNPYSVAHQVPIDAKNGEVTIIFKDEYKVRLIDKESGKPKQKEKISYKDNSNDFSLVSESDEIKKIKKLFRDYKIKEIFTSSNSQEQADNSEQALEKDCECDSPNSLSVFAVYPENQNIKEFVETLRQNTIVREANYSQKNTLDYIPSDEIFSNSSILAGVPEKVSESLRYYYNKTNMPKAWDKVEENNIIPPNVAVIDDGFINSHEDKVDYILKDGNKYVSCNPDCIESTDPNTISYDILDYNSAHGGQVASVIASPNNGKGTTGYSYKSKILPIKVMGNSSASIERAIEYIVNNRQALNIKVINISKSELLGTNTSRPIENYGDVHTKIDDARKSGILTVISAGNFGNQIATVNPSTAIVVGGVAKYKNTRWITSSSLQSNYGKRVDISAPAEDIVVPSQNIDNIVKYRIIRGTSFAAPQVAATAALLMGISSRPDLSTWDEFAVDKVKSLILNSATPIQSDYPLGSGVDTAIVPNGRMLNVYKALDIALSTQSGKSYARLFNTDYYSDVGWNYATNSISPALWTYYKEDKMVEIPNSANTVTFGTYNMNCVYSWGYQIWKDGHVTVQRVKGIAGKMKPLKASDSNPAGTNGTDANNVFYNVLNSTNAYTGLGMTGTGTPEQYYHGPDIYFDSTGLWK